MADEIERTPEQLATLEARRKVKARVDEINTQVAELQDGIDALNTRALEARDQAVSLTLRRDVLLAEKQSLLTPLATLPADGGEV